jgi:hypothetical protein
MKTAGVRFHISLAAAASMVEEIANDCVDLTTGAYFPQAFQLSLQAHLLEYFTDIPMPKTLEEMYALFNQSGSLYKRIVALINTQQLNDIREAARRLIDFRLNQAISIQAHQITAVAERIDHATEALKTTLAALADEDVGAALGTALDNIHRLIPPQGGTPETTPETATEAD